MLDVRLVESEQRIARWIANERQRLNRAGGIRNRQVGPQAASDTDYSGFAGEMAFCKLFNLYPDFSLHVRSGGYDCLWDGLRTDVKTTRTLDGRLLGEVEKRHDPMDAYVLMLMHDDSLFAFAGWATGKELFAARRKSTCGRGPVYAIPQCDLRPYQGRFDF